MDLKEYSNIIQDILVVCKQEYINANIKKIQTDIKRGIDKNFIIHNLELYK